MATPHVAGAAALIWSRGDVTTNQQVVDLLLNNADPSGVSNVRLDSWTIHGGLNLHDALSDGLATGKPVANAGPDQTVTDADGDGAEVVSFDGSASHDDNGSVVAYEWREGTTPLGSGALMAVSLTAGTHADARGHRQRRPHGTDSVTVTVQPRSLVTIAASVTEAREAGLQPGIFTLTRQGDTSAAQTVSYVVSGSATAGADYQPLPGTALFGAGQATTTITVTPIDDELLESNESVVVTLSPGAGYGVGSPASASVAVVSDDLPPDLTITATAAPATGAADTDIVVTDTTKNAGTGSAIPSATGFYLSSNSSFDAADIFLGSRPVPRLDPAATHSASTTLHIPATTATGSVHTSSRRPTPTPWSRRVSRPTTSKPPR
jgi:hypothetical protein